MDKPWLQHYSNNVPETIDPDQYANVVDIILEACETYSDKVAFSNFSAEKTYAEVEQLSRDFAAFLQTKLGISKGDRIAVMAPNMMSFPVAMFGILRAGATQVNVNPLYTARELEHQLKDSGATAIVIYAGSTSALAECIENTSIETVIVTGLHDLIEGDLIDGGLVVSDLESPEIDHRLGDAIPFMDALNSGAGLGFEPPEIRGKDLIFLQYTGGTTGPSKGAALSHRNLVANMMQYEAFGGAEIKRGEEIVITAIPIYHIFALMVNCLSYFHFGGTIVLITNPRDLPLFVKLWAPWRATVFTGVNTLYNGLLHTPGFADLDFSGLKVSIGGGSAMQLTVSEKWKDLTGWHIKEAYGLSETSPLVTVNLFTKDIFRSAIGIPLPSTDVSIRNDGGDKLPAGQAGELCVRGPQVMQGYWQRPDATKDALTHDGFFRTGDVASMDEDGYFHIVDRKKDMILVSGFNVYPNEIEAHIAAMNGIVECACVGVADERTGEAVKLFVVAQDTPPGIEEIKEFARQGLAPYKIPASIEFIPELPKSTVGKILRRKLRDL
jgi:long-chain acyl-CoA synthetase